MFHVHILSILRFLDGIIKSSMGKERGGNATLTFDSEGNFQCHQVGPMDSI